MTLRVVGDDGEHGDARIPGEKQGPGRPAAPEFDPWDTDKGHSYSVNTFYTRSTNKFDHSKETRAAIPTHIHGQIQHLVESKKFGQYRSIGDFMRDAAVHRLRTIAGWLNDEELVAILTMEELICKAEQKEAELLVKDSLLIAYNNGMERNVKDHDVVRLTEAISEIEDLILRLTSPHLEQAIEMATKYRGELKRLQAK